MAKKKSEGKVTINKFETIMKEEFENEVAAQWHGVDLVIKKTISFRDMMAFVDEVVANSFLDDGTYIPHIMDMVVRGNVICRYAGFTLPSDIEAKYRLLYETDAFNFVFEHINKDQFNAIMDSVERMLRHELNVEIRDAKIQLSTAAAAFDSMEKQTKDLFGSLTEDDVMMMLKMVSNGFDEKKIANAVLSGQSANSEKRPVADSNIIEI